MRPRFATGQTTCAARGYVGKQPSNDVNLPSPVRCHPFAFPSSTASFFFSAGSICPSVSRCNVANTTLFDCAPQGSVEQTVVVPPITLTALGWRAGRRVGCRCRHGSTSSSGSSAAFTGTSPIWGCVWTSVVGLSRPPPSWLHVSVSGRGKPPRRHRASARHGQWQHPLPLPSPTVPRLSSTMRRRRRGWPAASASINSSLRCTTSS